jgi:hypothetical protein
VNRACLPRLSNPNIVIRLARSRDEVCAADALVFRNYVADGFWHNDPAQLDTNPFLRSAARTVVLALEGSTLLGTLSIIEDSSTGLPSDGTQRALLQEVRRTSRRPAEVSALAMDRGATSHRRLILFLISYLFQYAFYHAGLDRLIASCKPEHADFYESMLCFRKLSDLTYYNYSHAAGYLVSLDLLEAHDLLARKYAPDPRTGGSLYRFLMCDPQPCHDFPSGKPSRSRETDWRAVWRRRAA